MPNTATGRPTGLLLAIVRGIRQLRALADTIGVMTVRQVMMNDAKNEGLQVFLHENLIRFRKQTRR